MLKHGWKITVPITIVLIFGLGIGGYAVINEDNCKIRLFVEMKNLLKIETEVSKECNVNQ